jgi:acyl-CoA reductase-like NAD-dependent aldehyde dehydrogenase
MEFQHYINGQWTASSDGQTMPVVSPATGEVVAVVAKGTRDDVGRAVAAARAAQPAFQKLTAFERADLCHKVADEITKRREALAKHLALEQGKPMQAEAFGEVDTTAKMWRMAAEDAKRLEGTSPQTEDRRKRIVTIRQPRGVVGAITPWNFPLAIPTEYLAPGLVTGNALVWCPAPTVAGLACLLMECIAAAGVPAGIVNLVTGEGAVVGDEIAGHPGIAMVGFTGSSATGSLVGKRAAGKPSLLELGGNAPTLVFADADIKRAAESAGRGAIWNAGQICDSTERILVHRKIHDEFMHELLKVVAEFKLGHPLEATTTLGPMHTAREIVRIESHLADAAKQGAKIVVGGKKAEGLPTGNYFPATVVDGVRPEMLLNHEETFGPVAAVLTFDDEDEAVRIAHGSPTGLAAAVFTSDVGRGFRLGEQLQYGIVNINEGSAYWQLHTPFGGYSGKTSGHGRLGGRYTLEEMTCVKQIVFDIGG